MKRRAPQLPATVRILAPIPGSETLGDSPGPVTTPTRSGRATLVALDDVDVRAVVSGDVLVRDGVFHPRAMIVRTVRTAVHVPDPGQGEPFEVPVVDVLTRQGKALAFAPEDLRRVRLRGEIPAAALPAPVQSTAPIAGDGGCTT